LDLKGYGRLISFLKRNKIDIIHTHLFAANTVGRIAGRIANVPVIISTEHNTYINKSRACNFVDKMLARVTSRIVAVSDAVLTYSARQTGIDASLYENIPNCVPVDRIRELNSEEIIKKKKDLGIGPDQSVILSVGRLTEQKGFPYLIRAALEIIREYPETVFLIVGKGEIKEALEQQIRACGLGGHVRLLGFRNDIYDLMQISDIFAMPSLWEGFGVTLIEAGACRLPVVATAVGGIMEVIRDGENGFIVPAKDEKALVKGIGTLLSAPEKRFRMGICARQIVGSKFSGPAVARKMENLYRQLLAQHI
jgi:glycosyltransferase involved in cell wall biosynthesis